MMRIIVIWAILIAAYLILTNAGGFKTSLSAFSDFVTGTTKTLQGR